MAIEQNDRYPFILEGDAQAFASAIDAGTRTPFLKSLALEIEPRPKTRINSRFLQNVVRNVEGHNSILLRKDERQQQQSRQSRRHPTVEKVRAIEKEKLERVKQARQRSKSPARKSKAEE